MMNLTNATVIGFFSLPSPSLAERNPAAYSTAMAEAPKGAGTCAHCGTGILHHVIVSVAGEIAFIGCMCAEKVGGPTVKRCVREKLTSDQMAEREAAAEARRAEWRKVEDERKAALAARYDMLKDIITTLEAQKTEFHSSLASQLRIGSLSSRQAEFVCKAVVGDTGRRNKKNAAEWDLVYDKCTQEW
jgi:hypothetical protein